MAGSTITPLVLLIVITSCDCVHNVYNLTNEVQEINRKSPLVPAGEEVPPSDQEVGGVDITSVLKNLNNKEPNFNSLLKDVLDKVCVMLM